MHILLLRHGETANNIDNVTQDINNDIALAESAYSELDANLSHILECFAKYNVSDIYVSSMLRAKQTINYLDSKSSDIASIKHTVLHDLHEVNFGAFGGQPEDTVIQDKTMSFYRNATKQMFAFDDYFSYPDGESSIDIRQRCLNVVANVDKRADYDTDYGIVLVGHNRLFRHLLVELGHWQADKMFDMKLPHGDIYYVGDYSELAIQRVLQHIGHSITIDKLAN